MGNDPAALLKQANYIGGEWVSANSGETLEVNNPATGEIIGTVPNCGADETRAAIEAAQRAFLSYSKTSAMQRFKLMQDLHDAIMDNQEALAQLLSLEQGKPIFEARGEVGMSAGYILWYGQEARRVYGDVVPSPWADRRVQVLRQPVGVVGAITPWNFPSSMLARKIGPALATGCTVVAKPAEATPYSGLVWAMLAEQVGIPAGVINIVTGNPVEIGKELTSNPMVKKITFTGSTRVGKILLQQAATTVKKASMELGGNAPFIVFDDGNIDRAVEGAIAAKFRNAGQTCVCTNRFYAQEGIYDEFVEKLTAAAEKLVVGAPNDEGVQQGALINEAAFNKCKEFVADAINNGGRVTTGGAPHERGLTFFQPTVIADANRNMRFAREEIFGPIAPVFKFSTEEEAIQAANDTEFGLACYFYTNDLGRTHRVQEALQYGLVGVNEGVITTVEAPFGGFKESGLGREGGHQGLDDYLETKYVCHGGLGL